ncbi:MAG: OadG family protein [Desulfobacterota bacterium]|nr:OadG family protein [Thermodesulfobacteriota bacterium]
MADNSWLMALRVFLFGFSGVFLSLIILMYFVKAMSAIVQRNKKKKS